MRRPTLVVAAVSAALSAACTHSSTGAGPTRTPLRPTPSSSYETAVLADRPAALFPLRDADGLRPKDQVSDLSPFKASGTVVGGLIMGTTGPHGERGALFLRGGRIVTSLTTGFASTDAFSVEMQLRADACTSAWGRIVGTTDQTVEGREGVELIHFPAQFTKSACRVGAEIWHKNAYLGGCHPSAVPTLARWFSFTMTYANRRLSCYENGRLVEADALRAPATFSQAGPFGIGGSGSGFQGPADGVSLSEVGVYGRALTAAEVAAHSRAYALEGAATAPTPSSS